VCVAVVLHEVRVINRHELGLRLEVFDGIAAVGHHVCGQIIGLHNRDLRTIDEPALKFIPFREPSEGRRRTNSDAPSVVKTSIGTSATVPQPIQ
jgi:hypothetical protein